MSDVPMTRPEEALAIHHTTYFSRSTFVDLEDGRILHSAGGPFTTSEDGGINWSEEFKRIDSNGNPVGTSNASLVRLSGKGIGLAGRKVEKDAKLGQRHRILFWRSKDSGETWEPPIQVSIPGLDTHVYQDVLLRTSSGRIILPVYTHAGQSKLTGPGDVRQPASGRLVHGQWISTGAHFFDPGFSSVHIWYSDDEGHTWERNQDGDLFILMDWNAIYSYVNEPSVTEVSPGKLLMVMRTGLGRHFQAWSHDNGVTWTRPQPTVLAASTTPCQIRTLPNGHLLIVWNQENEEEIKRGYNRQRISSAVSRNGGSVWEFFQNVESLHEETRVEPGPIHPVRPEEKHFESGVAAPEREPEAVVAEPYYARFSYPSVRVLKDRVLITHSFTDYEEDSTKGQLVLRGREPGEWNQKLKVLPLTWFYGGKEPADNPALPRAHDPALP